MPAWSAMWSGRIKLINVCFKMAYDASISDESDFGTIFADTER